MWTSDTGRTLATLAGLVGLTTLAACDAGPQSLTIGSKNFTEQDILGELVARWIERTTDIDVERRLHLGGTFICHQAMLNGDIDLYIEYTGTALAAILEREESGTPEEVLETVRSEYGSRFALDWTEPLGFENTFAILVRESTADSLQLSRLSQAAVHAPDWTPGFGFEFVEREDGLRGLSATYGFRFGSAPRVMDLGLTYRALAAGEVDLIAGNSTDGQIELLGLRMLEDDQSYFPPYFAAPVVRRDALARFPELRVALRTLGGRLSTQDMRRLNAAVDVEGLDYRDVAEEWVGDNAPIGNGRRNN